MANSHYDLNSKFFLFVKVYKTYNNNTFRYGPLHQVSIVGTVHEEVGGYFPKIISILEKSPFLQQVMPWGPMSAVKMDSPTESNDGPILWIRPGEQLIPTACLSSSGSATKRSSSNSGNLRGLLRRVSGPRELMFEDRHVFIFSIYYFVKLNIFISTELNVMQIMLDKVLIVKQQPLLVF